MVILSDYFDWSSYIFFTYVCHLDEKTIITETTPPIVDICMFFPILNEMER
ncbi:MAG: hypothetical protein OEW23_15000 [Candidatus Aminicenantes bacterium]|nr:hypothetical protein [Candidatus Aminicenantes bacterium]